MVRGRIVKCDAIVTNWIWGVRWIEARVGASATTRLHHFGAPPQLGEIMAEVVFSVGHAYRIQDINVRSSRGRLFTIDLVEVSKDRFGVWILVDDPLGIPRIKFFRYPNAHSDTAAANFKTAVEYAVEYLQYADPNDSIEAVHNPCNTPFLATDEQEAILRQLGIAVGVGVN